MSANTKEKLKIPSLDEMIKAGVHFGHRTSKWHPKMKSYIAGVVNTIHLIDLNQTISKLESAIVFLREQFKQNKIILFVGTAAPHRRLVKQIAEECGMPYVNEKWVGGFLTNFKTVSKRLEYFRNLEKKQAAGELEKYTKKEQQKFDQELKKLHGKFGGIKNMTKLPDVLLVVNCYENALAIKEARETNIPAVALCDTNIDPILINYPIPANDDAISSVKLILETIRKNLSANT